jgi:DNA-nicking Smr family endonuclease
MSGMAFQRRRWTHQPLPFACKREVNITAKKLKNKCRSFIELEDLLAQKTLPCKPVGLDSTNHRGPQGNAIDNDDEKRLFDRAMADVKPIRTNKRCPNDPTPKANPVCSDDDDQEVIDKLEDLVSRGKGFKVSLTPEYIEGITNGESHHILKRLHQGHFAVQDHIDLHGFTIIEAQKAFDRFLHRSITHGMRTLLIVHGRGLSSPVGPVIKNHVSKWLTSGPWAKWVMAFASARACDGGTGATYVLLRNRPLSKKARK